MSEQFSRNPADIEAERAADDAAYDGKWHDFAGIEVGDSEKLDDVIANVHFRREEEATEAHYKALEELDKAEVDARMAEEEQQYVEQKKADTEGHDEDKDDPYDIDEDENGHDESLDEDEDYGASYINGRRVDDDQEDPLAGDVDKWVHPDETRTDNEIDRDEQLKARKHMAGGDGADDYWDEYDALYPEDEPEQADAQ